MNLLTKYESIYIPVSAIEKTAWPKPIINFDYN